MEYTLNTSIAEDTSTIQKAIEQIADNEAADSKADGHGQLPENPSRETGVPVSSGQKASVHHWFFTFMWINIPVIGWFYLFYLAFNKKYLDRQSFAVCRHQEWQKTSFKMANSFSLKKILSITSFSKK